ncbi:MAG: hypothetical protein IT355_09960 [Gemmatimonadaceae bacterium]|nr:hypothetical protein [Gemmatimonadaceae bacterium]
MSTRVRALLLMACAFLPYLPGGLRTEHLLFTALALWGAIAFGLGRCRLPAIVLAAALALFVSLVALAMSSTVSPDAGADASVVSSFIRLMLPPVICLAAATVFAHEPAATVVVSRAILGVAIPVGAVAALSAVTDIGGLLGPWVRSGETSVWAQALAIGRFTGIFNQPLEAGTFYSVALFAAIYLRARRQAGPLFLGLGMLCVLAGGMLSLSKNFVVLGLGLGVLLAIALRVIRLTTAILVSVAGLAAIGIGVWRFNETYATSLLDLLDSGGVVLALTAGRFGGSETDVGQLFTALYTQSNWVAGFGLGAHLPLDNGYLEYFYQGGVLAITGYACWLLLLLLAAVQAPRSAEGRLLATLTLFVAVASLGGPVITANRANVALLCLMTVAAHSAVRQAAQESPSRGRTVPVTTSAAAG